MDFNEMPGDVAAATLTFLPWKDISVCAAVNTRANKAARVAKYVRSKRERGEIGNFFEEPFRLKIAVAKLIILSCPQLLPDPQWFLISALRWVDICQKVWGMQHSKKILLSAFRHSENARRLEVFFSTLDEEPWPTPTDVVWWEN